MLISPPFLPDPAAIAAYLRDQATRHTNADAEASAAVARVQDPLMDRVDDFERAEGIYPLCFDRRWHGGIHLLPDVHSPVRAIADGEVVAYRVCQQAYDTGEGCADSNAGFVLLKHTTDTGEGRTITFYSLYMHLLDLSSYRYYGWDAQQLPAYLRMPTPGSEALSLPLKQRRPGPAQPGAGHKVYRKDILGWLGACHGQLHLHFEIFMTEEDVEAYFATTQLGHPHPKTPDGADVWGRSYYVIPGGSSFCRQPPERDDAKDFPPLQSGQLDAAHTLYVETYFHNGQRYTRSWRDPGDGHLLPLNGGQAECEGADDEYALYERATKYYPECPSDGYELLRFGRMLSSPTLADNAVKTPPGFAPELAGNPKFFDAPNPRTTWVPVRFSDGERGYIDIHDANIQKLSDADFPSFMDWRKIREADGLFDPAGLCDIEVMGRFLGQPTLGQTLDEQEQERALVPALSPSKDDPLIRYLKRHDGVRRKLRGFVCQAISEWDSSHYPKRYRKLLEEGEFYHGRQADYDTFITRWASFQFWDKTGLPTGKPVWFFHPLQFIRHFRKCGWLSENELIQTLPTSAMRQVSYGQFVSEPVKLNDPRIRTIQSTRIELNKSLRKFGIAPSPWRMAAFLANAMVETQWFSTLYEGNKTAWYHPWDGRGFLQLTGPDNYIKYWRFLGREIPISLAKELSDAAAKAHKESNNGALQDARHPRLIAEIVQWRKDVEGDSRPFDTTNSAGAYWAWTGAARYADQAPNWRLRAQYTSQDKKTHIYYQSDSFGQVAATVNFGGPVKNMMTINKVNGIVARCQAYTSAVAILADNAGFPDGNNQLQIMPDGFERREV